MAPPLRRLIPVWTYLLGCGLFWEYVTPLYPPRSVSDPWDILAVWLGGTVMLLFLRPANWARSQSSPPNKNNLRLRYGSAAGGGF